MRAQDRSPRDDVASDDAAATGPGRARAGRPARAPGAWRNVVASQDEQFALKRAALLREAARAFGERGYHATSLDDVAAALGVTKPALYHYVRGKEEILFECHMRSLDLGDRALTWARTHGRTGLEKTRLLARRYVEMVTGEMGHFGVLSEYDALEPEHRAIVGRRRDRFDRAMRRLLAEGVADGSIRAIDPRLTVFFFMGAVNWMARWYRPEGPSSGADIAQAFDDLLALGIRGAPPGAASVADPARARPASSARSPASAGARARTQSRAR